MRGLPGLTAYPIAPAHRVGQDQGNVTQFYQAEEENL